MIGLASCRLHCVHTWSLSLPVSQLTASSMATLFSIHLYKNRSDYRALELDEGVLNSFSILLRLRKENFLCAGNMFPNSPKQLLQHLFTLYLTIFIQYQSWDTYCAKMRSS